MSGHDISKSVSNKLSMDSRIVSGILSEARTPVEPKRSLQTDGSGVIITEEMMDRAFDKAYHAGELTGRYKRAYEKRMGIEDKDAASHSRWPAAYRKELNSKDTSLTKEQERSIEFWTELPINLVAVALALPLTAALAVAASPFLLALFAGERIHNLLKPKFRKNLNLGAVNDKAKNKTCEKMTPSPVVESKPRKIDSPSPPLRPALPSPDKASGFRRIPLTVDGHDPRESLGLKTENELNAYLAWKKNQEKPSEREYRDRWDCEPVATGGNGWSSENYIVGSGPPRPKLSYGATRSKNADPVISFDRLADQGEQKKLCSGANSLVNKAALQLRNASTPKTLPDKGNADDA